MKRIIRVLTLLSVVCLFAVTTGKAQIVVRVRPNRPSAVVVARPHRPSDHHVWVAEEWTPNGARYDYHAGYWAVPARPGATWVAGHWGHRHGGYVWIAGHWR
jgi:hypothetical protein